MKQNPSSSLFLSHPGWAEQWIEPHHKHHHQNIQNFGCILDKKGGGYWERNEPWDLWLPLTSISSNHIFHISLTLMASEIEIDIWYVPVHFLCRNWFIRVMMTISFSTNSRLHYSNFDKNLCIHTMMKISFGCLFSFNFYLRILWISSTPVNGFLCRASNRERQNCF